MFNNNDLLTLALLRKTQNRETYDGETEKTILENDSVFNTAGKIVNDDLKVKLGYEVIHGGKSFIEEE